MFEINNDMGNIKYKNWLNWFHFCASILFVITVYYSYDHKDILLSGLTAWTIGILWEIGDGFKDWYYEFKYDNEQPKWFNWLRQNFIYADKFSLQDVLIWDLSGCVVGIFILTMVI